MIVTNEQIRNGEFDEAILRQIRTLCEQWKIRYNQMETTPFHLGFKFKDIDRYE